jgi:signal transduction histidine kinase
LQRALSTHARRAIPEAVIRAANEFFTECLSPFEMSHRGAREGARAWQRLNEALENEAKRIAHALHDEAGQLLASVHFVVAEMADELPPQGRARLQEVKALLNRIETELRNLSHELRPIVLDRLGLLPALQFLAENVTRRAGIPITVKGEEPGRLPPVVEITLYRIVQEALNNVLKHARASSASVELEVGLERVACTIRDNGVGFAAERIQNSDGLGLAGIRERLNALGGSLHFASRPKRGTELRAEVPRGR